MTNPSNTIAGHMPCYLTLLEVAQKLGISDMYVWNLIRDGALKGYSSFGKFFILETDLDELNNPNDLGYEDGDAWLPVYDPSPNKEWFESRAYALADLRRWAESGELPAGIIFERVWNGKTIRFDGTQFEYLGIFAFRRTDDPRIQMIKAPKRSRRNVKK